jgi:hypothetical protein
MNIGPRTRLGAIGAAVAIFAGAVLSVGFSDWNWVEAALMLAIGVGLILVLGKLAGITGEIARLRSSGDAFRAANSPGEPLDMLRRDLQRDVSALFALNRLLPFAQVVPAPGGWAATPDTLLALVGRIIGTPGPTTVVECGSGTSTVWMALALKQRGEGRMISLEHDPAFAKQTRARLAELGLDDVAEVRDAPIETVSIDSVDYSWYSPGALSGIQDVSLLFVDGPPGALGRNARFPAGSMLGDRVVDGGWIVLDDIDREDERKVLERWLSTPLGPRTLVKRSETDRAAIIEVTGRSGVH